MKYKKRCKTRFNLQNQKVLWQCNSERNNNYIKENIICTVVYFLTLDEADDSREKL